MHKFVVVGLYADNGQRFCDTVEARTAEAAERKAIASAEAELDVAAVFRVRLSTGDLVPDPER